MCPKAFRLEKPKPAEQPAAPPAPAKSQEELDAEFYRSEQADKIFRLHQTEQVCANCGAPTAKELKACYGCGGTSMTRYDDPKAPAWDYEGFRKKYAPTPSPPPAAANPPPSPPAEPAQTVTATQVKPPSNKSDASKAQ